jgi:hypothetical protein
MSAPPRKGVNVLRYHKAQPSTVHASAVVVTPPLHKDTDDSPSKSGSNIPAEIDALHLIALT